MGEEKVLDGEREQCGEIKREQWSAGGSKERRASPSVSASSPLLPSALCEVARGSAAAQGKDSHHTPMTNGHTENT